MFGVVDVMQVGSSFIKKRGLVDSSAPSLARGFKGVLFLTLSIPSFSLWCVVSVFCY